MKLRTCVLSALALCTPLVRAQYFSEGWKPGQPVTQAYDAVPTGSFDPSQPQPERKAPPSLSGEGNWLERILTSGPITHMFEKTGVNITERLEAAHNARVQMWDQRIPLLTDDNWEELVVNETFSSEQEERDRVWFFVITAQASNEAMSKYVDRVFDATYNVSLAADDVPNVRFARMDYLNVTYLTTKWNIWAAPYLVVAKDRGQSLRFYRPAHIRLDSEALHRFLKVSGYEETPVWNSSFGPGGSNEWLMHYFARFTLALYNITMKVPRFALMALTGFAGSFLIQLFHRGDKKKKNEAQERVRRAAIAQEKRQEIARAAREKSAQVGGAVPPTPLESPAKSSPSKKKKGGKK